jgi:hypothetical protein
MLNDGISIGALSSLTIGNSVKPPARPHPAASSTTVVTAARDRRRLWRGAGIVDG